MDTGKKRSALWEGDTAMDIIAVFEASRDPEKAFPMENYMRNRFPFLGIQKPQRAVLAKSWLKEVKKSERIDWDFLKHLYSLPEREYHYLVYEYLSTLKHLLKEEDMESLEFFIVERAWWDTVDALSSNIVGHLVRNHPGVKPEIRKWIHSDNLWLRRAAILCQLKFRGDTDLDLLEEAIVSGKDTGEFFLNKAIGWALRNYSKHDPDYVKAFITRTPLHPLSIREGSHYLT
jgi:3-methyladenine DNA glycosylase AlkD